MEYVKEAHTALFSGPTSCGKTQRMLDLIEKEYMNHFEYIVILCPTLRLNDTYLERPWVWKDPHVLCIEPKEKNKEKEGLIWWIEQLSRKLEGCETLFIIDDMIADESLDKKRSDLLELAVFGRHANHYMWFLTQSYTAIPKNLRRQKKMLFLWYPAERSDLKTVDEETNIIESPFELRKIRDELKNSEHGCLYFRMKYPRGYTFLP